MDGILKYVIIGVVIIVIGVPILLALGGGVAKQSGVEMNRYDALGKNTALEIDFGAGSLKTVYYDGEKIAIDYPTAWGLDCKIIETNEKLTFKSNVKWWLFFVSKREIPETIIYLPRDSVYDLDVKLGAGSVALASGTYGAVKIKVGAGVFVLNDSECASFNAKVSAGKFDITKLTCNVFAVKVSAGTFNVAQLVCGAFDTKVSAGKLSVGALVCSDIKANVSAGSTDVTVWGIKSEYTILVSNSAGSCNVNSQKGTTDKTLVANCSAGSIRVEFTES